MNDMTPRRLSGSLLERAADLYDLSPRRPPEAPAPPAPADVIADNISVPTFAPLPPADDLPPRAAVALASPARVTIDRALLAERGMLVPGAAVTPLAEEFRLIKRQLLATARRAAGEDARSILVCSARADDGKTFCAINLALSLAAERDVEAVLVDADFIQPDVLATLGAEHHGPGLLDAIADPAIDVEDYILATDVPQLSILPAGARSHSDTELLASDHGRAVLDRLEAGHPRRIVVYDSPPVLAASPAGVLAGHVGQAMLVVRADRTSESELRTAVAQLDACAQVQLVLNAVSYRQGGPRMGSYYGAEDAA